LPEWWPPSRLTTSLASRSNMCRRRLCSWLGGCATLSTRRMETPRMEPSGQKYDLICMDIMMPEMDGQTAVKEIRALEEAGGTLSTQGVKIIMTTALD